MRPAGFTAMDFPPISVQCPKVSESSMLTTSQRTILCHVTKVLK